MPANCRVARLAVIPAQTPVPASLLCLLWQCTEAEVATTLSALAAKALLNVAKLPDGRVWCLPQQDQLAALHASCRDRAPRDHARLLDGYTSGGLLPLAAVGDDGYFVQNVGHHLVGAGRLDQLRGLLLDPGWLVVKLGAAGVAGVVADFRRWVLDVCLVW